MKRPIPKHPDLPKGFEKIETLVENLIFMPRNENPADVLFIFGARSSKDKIVQETVQFLEGKNTYQVIITGGIPQFEDSPQFDTSESSEILAAIRPQEFPDVKFYIEENSHHSQGNINEAQKIFDFNNNCTSIAFITRNSASKRQGLLLQKSIPEKQLYALPYNDFGKEAPNADQLNWMKNNFAAKRVWGEVLRLDSYAARGSITLSLEDAHTLSQIKTGLKLHPTKLLTEQLKA